MMTTEGLLLLVGGSKSRQVKSLSNYANRLSGNVDGQRAPKRKPEKSQLGQLPTMRGGLALVLTLELGDRGIFGACARLHFCIIDERHFHLASIKRWQRPRKFRGKLCEYFAT